MKLRALFTLLATALVFAGCEKEAYSPEPPDTATTTIMGVGQVVKGNIIVKFSEVPQTKSVEASLPQLDGLRMERLFPENEKYAERHKAHGLDRWYRISFNPEISVSEAFKAVKGVEHVETVEFVPVIKQAAAPFNDPYLSYQWHYHNTGQKTGYVSGMDINLFKAWEIETGKEEVIVSVVDQGVEYSNADLADNMWINKAEKNGTTGIDDDNNGFIDDIYGYNFCAVGNSNAMYGTIQPGDHGTHVAGTIAAVNGNGIFGCGIAGGDGTNKGVRIMTCQTMNNNKDGAYIGMAFTYAADNGAVISQNSWSLDGQTTTPAFIVEAIDYFIKYAGMDQSGRNQVGPMAGGVVIFAAGNDNKDFGVPGMIDQVIAVASTGPTGKKATYSNYGKWVDIAAPGGENGAYPAGDVYSTVSGNAFGQMSGTSMACPHVSGVAALVVSRYGGEGFTNTQLKEILLGSANYDKLYDVNPDYKARQVSALITTPDKLGVGALDAYKAVTFLGDVEDDDDDTPQETVPDPVDNIAADDTKATASSIAVKWEATATNGEPTYGYNVFYSKESLAQLDPENPGSSVKSAFADGSSAKPGQMMSMTISNLESNTTYHVRIQAVNANKTGSALSPEITAATKVNLPPVISPSEKITATLKATQKQAFEYKLSDPENDNLTESFTAGSAAASISRSGNTVTVTIDALKADEGTYNATLTVTDVAGNTATAEIAYTILPNNKPVSTTAFSKFVMNKGESTTINLDQHFTDTDGDKLTYVVSSSDNTVTNCTVQGNTLTIYATSYGTATVGVFAKDARNATSSTSSMQILVRNTKEALDVYPTTVQTTLNIRTATDGNADILVTGASGAAVYAKSSVATGPFNPHTINTTEWGAGVYSVEVTINGNKYKKTVVKL